MTREEKNKFQNCGEFSWKALEKHAEDMSNPLIFLPITYYSHDPKLFRLKEQALKSNSKFKICDFTNFENIILLIDAEKIKEIRYATFPISSSKNRPLKAKFNRDDQNKTTGNLEAEFYFEIEFMDNCGSLFDLPKDTPIDLDDLTDLT